MLFNVGERTGRVREVERKDVKEGRKARLEVEHL
jgi:hypothetical protein